jgi:hypothetical protein
MGPRASRTRGSGIRESTLPFTGRSASPDPCLSTVLLHGPPGGACGRSEYGDGSLIQLGRRKTSTIVTPETIRDFTSHTLEQLGLDPMYPAALCELVRSKTLTKRPQDHLSAILASLGSACACTVGGKRLTVVGFRDPMSSDPDGKLYHEAVNVWESPAQVTKRTADAPG